MPFSSLKFPSSFGFDRPLLSLPCERTTYSLLLTENWRHPSHRLSEAISSSWAFSTAPSMAWPPSPLAFASSVRAVMNQTASIASHCHRQLRACRDPSWKNSLNDVSAALSAFFYSPRSYHFPRHAAKGGVTLSRKAAPMPDGLRVVLRIAWYLPATLRLLRESRLYEDAQIVSAESHHHARGSRTTEILDLRP